MTLAAWRQQFTEPVGGVLHSPDNREKLAFREGILDGASRSRRLCMSLAARMHVVRSQQGGVEHTSVAEA
jgi:hypothetical protein